MDFTCPGASLKGHAEFLLDNGDQHALYIYIVYGYIYQIDLLNPQDSLNFKWSALLNDWICGS